MAHPVLAAKFAALFTSAVLQLVHPHHHHAAPAHKPVTHHQKHHCPGGVAGWFCKADAILSAAHIPHSYSAERIIAFGESNNNPSAAPGTPGYNCDSNCVAGTPSEGLMQLIPAAFQQYALPGHTDTPLNPVSSIIASVRYADARYGSVDNVPGVVSVRAGGAYGGY